MSKSERFFCKITGFVKPILLWMLSCKGGCRRFFMQVMIRKLQTGQLCKKPADTQYQETWTYFTAKRLLFQYVRQLSVLRRQNLHILKMGLCSRVRDLLFLVALIAILLWFGKSRNCWVSGWESTNLISIIILLSPGKEENILDGCKHVYLDMGTNIGVQIRKLYEPHLFPNASVLPIFDKFFGRQGERCFSFDQNSGVMQ